MDKQLLDLQSRLESAVQRAIESCEAADHATSDHFPGVAKMVELGSGSKRGIDEIAMASGSKPRQKALTGRTLCKPCELLPR